MSLDGLRAWIGLLERKLTMRTRVFLVLLAIAIGGAGAALYLAIDAQDSAVSESELQSLREELGGEGGAAATGSVSQLEAEVEALQGEVAALQSAAGSDAGSEGSGGTGTGATDSTGGTAGAASGGAGVPKNQQQLEELVEEAQKKAEAGD